MQNIVEYCQVNRNPFYYHFQDIPALTEYSIQEWTEENSKIIVNLERRSNALP
ncbi:hypothetical protein [Schaedlerella arabinosiphila]|uniref:hypothetical protein n=1 Tax=Schaedlerella arabinosiphila TaxID=2044587 RepID=UPI001FA97C90